MKKRECARTAQCPRRQCREDETVRHIFWEFPFAKNVWHLLGQWLNDLYKDEMTYESIMYGFLKIYWGRGGEVLVVNGELCQKRIMEGEEYLSL